MRVAEILRETGVTADHYRVYEDPITGKNREIDVVGYLDQPRLSVHLVIECKHSQDKPWVLFCTMHHRITPNGYVVSVPATPKARELIEPLAYDESVQNMIMFKARSLVGFRLVRAYTDNQDTAFHAVVGVSSASISTAEAIGRHDHAVTTDAVSFAGGR